MSEIPPTRMNQQIFKGKMKAAQGGHKLLKKKADALKVCIVAVIVCVPFESVEESDLTKLLLNITGGDVSIQWDDR